MHKFPVEISILRKINVYIKTYPSQFWLLFWGMLVSTIGMSMIWPFLVVYISDELSLPMSTITTLISINAIMSLASSLIAGAITDKIGRKWAMVLSFNNQWDCVSTHDPGQHLRTVCLINGSSRCSSTAVSGGIRCHGR